MNKGRSLYAVGLFAFVFACSGGGETSTPLTVKPAIEQVPADKPLPPPAVGDTHDDERDADNDCESTWDAKELAESATAPFDAIDLQLDGSPTFAITQGLYGTRVYTRMPALTLYRDGTVLYPEHEEIPRKYLTAQLTRAEAEDLKAKVLALGAERLKSHTETCTCPKDTPLYKGVFMCMDDASYHIIRFRDHKDALRHIVVYGSFWNRPKIAAQVTDLLKHYRAKSETAFNPDHATLYIQREEHEPSCKGSLPADVAKLIPGKDEYMNLVALEGSQLRSVQTVIPVSGGMATWCNAGVAWHAFMYAWLPEADHHAVIAQYMHDMRAPPTSE